jgi:UPF0271 protein
MNSSASAMRIDLNCDLGEAADDEQLAAESRVIPHVTSVNVACAFHAGTPEIMRNTIRLARALGTAIGAHPGFQDREGHGRRVVLMPPPEVETLVACQVAALAGVAALEGAALSHVKPHGALYNLAGSDRLIANAIAGAVASVDRRLIVFGLAGSLLIQAARAIGLGVAEEAFADRAYSPGGTLLPRDLPGAVIHDEQEVVRRAVRLAREGVVSSYDGRSLAIRADTICLHGDTPGADRLARALREALAAAGVRVVAVGRD